jgi:hypothetical protein
MPRNTSETQDFSKTDIHLLSNDEIIVRELFFCGTIADKPDTDYDSLSAIRGQSNGMLNTIKTRGLQKMDEENYLSKRYPEISLEIHKVIGIEVVLN